mmetsp:Transcript_97153/g.192516  ORF Transcript_97153/g.192516 Transcript_97153/m.192516 type:complete len:162 (-) Transcript_97153:161-646(-)
MCIGSSTHLADWPCAARDWAERFRHREQIRGGIHLRDLLLGVQRLELLFAVGFSLLSWAWQEVSRHCALELEVGSASAGCEWSHVLGHWCLMPAWHDDYPSVMVDAGVLEEQFRCRGVTIIACRWTGLAVLWGLMPTRMTTTRLCWWVLCWRSLAFASAMA